MKADWQKLMKAYAGHETILVGDVDCEGSGKELCEKVGIEGFPAIKWGDPSDLQDYEGERKFKELQAFAKESLKPQCSPAHIELCEGEKKATIEKYSSMSDADLTAFLQSKEEALKKLDDDFQTFVSGLEEQLKTKKKKQKAKLKEQLMESYSDEQGKVMEQKDAIKMSGYKIAKSVQNYKEKMAKEKEKMAKSKSEL